MARMLIRLFALVPALLLLGCVASRQDFGSDNPALPFNKAVLTGDTLYVSGHLGLDPDTGKPPADAAAEARRMLDAVGWGAEAAACKHVGVTLEDGSLGRGMSLAISAPLDGLYAACTLNEWALDAAVASFSSESDARHEAEFEAARAAGKDPQCEPPPDEWINPEALP